MVKIFTLICICFTTTLCGSPVMLLEGLLEPEGRSSGLTSVPATHETLYFAADETFRFCHQANLAVYEDQLYLIWTNGILHENETGQRVLWSKTEDGRNWREWSVLVDDPDGIAGALFAVATGLFAQNGKLNAYFATIRDPDPIYREASIHVMVSDDGESWGESFKLLDGYGIESPRRLESGRILMPGQVYPIPEGLTLPPPRILYTDSGDGITGWKDAEVPLFPEFEERFPEGNWFVRKDGSLVVVFRAPNSVRWLYASESADNGASWSVPVRTNLPSATSRMSTGNLPDGRAFCIWNPSQKTGRNPLVISLSEDGRVFDKAYVIRGERTTQRFKGKRKSDGWQYPSAVVWKDSLWVAYSVNKEDMVVTKIKLEDLN